MYRCHSIKSFIGVKQSNQGFALIATISIMVLLVMMALAMLTLSSITIRASAHDAAQNEARANARLAAMMAFGELQELAGRDTRITANSRMFSASNPNATGVWRSWEGSDRDTSGRPEIPDYASKVKAGDPRAQLASDADGRFLGYLVSSAVNNVADPKIPIVGLSSVASGSSIPLVANGSVATPADEVHVMPTMLSDGQSKGAIAWWVSGENSKALIAAEHGESPATVVAWHQRIQSNGRADPDYFGLEEVNDLPPAFPLPSNRTLELLDENAELRKLHDMTTFSQGLLTNTATGGWRRDLSLLAENFSGLPSSGLPSFTIKPGQVHGFNKTSPSSRPSGALLYPWADFPGSDSTKIDSQTPAICPWNALVDYLVQYKSLTSSSAQQTQMPIWLSGYTSYTSNGTYRYNFQDRVRRAPVPARMDYILSFATTNQTDPEDPEKTRRLALLVTPVLTVWNPYNVELRCNHFYMRVPSNSPALLPIEFSFKVKDEAGQETTYPETRLRDFIRISGVNNDNGMALFYRASFPFTLPPGGTRVFSPDQYADSTSRTNMSLWLSNGYGLNRGFLFRIGYEADEVYLRETDTVSLDGFWFNGSPGATTDVVNPIYASRINSISITRDIQNRTQYSKSNLENYADTLYPPIDVDQVNVLVSDLNGNVSQPFAVVTHGMRPATPRPNRPEFANHHSKGMLDHSPLQLQSNYDGHPSLAPADYTFSLVNGWNDTRLPQAAQDGSFDGYILSGVTAQDGLRRCIVAELPTRPVQSLAALQHFDARNNNRVAPYRFNLIANSTASSLLEPDQVFQNSSSSTWLRNDDSYALNHVLFDDWFVSSIAPDVNDFSAVVERDTAKVYEDHLGHTQPLPNRWYVPARNASESFDVTAVTQDPDTMKYSYEAVASQLEVLGMMNINSVSLDAWKSWLRQNRKVRVPYIAADGSTQLDAETSYAFPRTSISGDRAAGSDSSLSNPQFPEANEYAGYRTLSDKQVDALAEEIVSEIRKRGPFLSLSEFVNRKLTSDKSLAAAGAIQQALDNLSQDASADRNPYLVLQQHAPEITQVQPGVNDPNIPNSISASHQYQFPEVSLGSAAFGVPGWIRQADVLRSLAPMMSARDDTFTIRAYGDARDKNGAIVARAWCEMTVTRRANYVDGSDLPQADPFDSTLSSEANKKFGRKFGITSFRWLNENEI